MNVTEPTDIDVLALFASICDRTSSVLAGTTDWGESGRRAGQYRVDLDVDDVCVEPLLAAGFSVLSEESGVQHPGEGPSALGTVVVDPLDGSTNASLGLPWFATSLCLVVDGEPIVSMVANLATGARYEAVRGGGARLDGVGIVGRAARLRWAMRSSRSVACPITTTAGVSSGRWAPRRSTSARWRAARSTASST